MSFFESKADREKREEEERMQQQQHEERMAKEASERRQKALDDFTEKVKDYAKGKDVFAITVSDIDFKQIVLDYMIKECGYICVQNDAFGTKYTTHYAFTFVKPEFANKFGVAN